MPNRWRSLHPVLDLVAVAIACALGVLAPAYARADKVDLSEYLAPIPTEGDTKVFRSPDTGERHVETVLSVEPYKGGWKFVIESESGTPPFADYTRLEQFRVGALLLAGSLEIENNPGVSGVLQPKKPKAFHRLVMRPGKRSRFKQKRTVFIEGRNAGKDSVRGKHRFVGFVDFETPIAIHEDALRIDTSQKEKQRVDGFKSRQTKKSSGWFVRGLGVVGEEAIHVVDGISGREEIETSFYLESAVVGGVPWP